MLVPIPLTIACGYSQSKDLVCKLSRERLQPMEATASCNSRPGTTQRRSGAALNPNPHSSETTTPSRSTPGRCCHGSRLHQTDPLQNLSKTDTIRLHEARVPVAALLSAVRKVRNHRDCKRSSDCCAAHGDHREPRHDLVAAAALRVRRERRRHHHH
jgi:hypothetical protein